MIILTIIIIVTTSFILLSMVLGALRNGIAPTPTTKAAKQMSLTLAESAHPSSIADLGAGFGTMVFPFAKKFPQADVVAYETAWFPWLILHVRKMIHPMPNLSIYRKNYMEQDLQHFDLFYTYLFPQAMFQLKPRLEMSGHFTLISNAFAVSGWTPDQVKNRSGLFYSTIVYLYSR